MSVVLKADAFEKRLPENSVGYRIVFFLPMSIDLFCLQIRIRHRVWNQNFDLVTNILAHIDLICLAR